MAMRHFARRCCALLLGLTLTTAVWADGGGGGSDGGGASTEADAAAAHPAYLQAVAAINDKRWPDAIRLLRNHVLQFGTHADGHNWLAYSYRQAGRLDEALRHYRRALGIDPRHIGAHEYIGEAYLMARQPDKARQHLQRLAQICGNQCDQYRDLAEAIEKYQKGTP